MDFLVALVDAYPMDGSVRQRINELFRRDDHAGDIVPIRRLPPSAALPTPEPPAGVSSSARGSSERSSSSLPLPSYSQPAAVKIELEEAPAPVRPPRHPRPVHLRRPSQGTEITPWWLVKWFLIILVFGQVFWWLYSFLRNHLDAGLR
jgi:hypothetical protein